MTTKELLRKLEAVELQIREQRGTVTTEKSHRREAYCYEDVENLYTQATTISNELHRRFSLAFSDVQQEHENMIDELYTKIHTLKNKIKTLQNHEHSQETGKPVKRIGGK